MTPKIKSRLLGLSTGDLKRMLAARERIDVLEGEKQRLQKDLAKVERELESLWAEGSGSTGRKAGRKKTTTKKAGVRKKVGGKKTSKAVKTRAQKGAKRVKLEDLVVDVLKKNGQPMNFKDLYGVIVKGKLVKTKSKNFDNVLRRTLSTSQLVKRVGRGVYGVA